MDSTVLLYFSVVGPDWIMSDVFWGQESDRVGGA